MKALIKFCCSLGMLLSLAPHAVFAEATTVKLAKGDGINKVFGPGLLLSPKEERFYHMQAVKGSITISDGQTTFRDNGTDGTLVEGEGSGFIDYASDAYYVIFSKPPANDTDITATFQYRPADTNNSQ